VRELKAYLFMLRLVTFYGLGVLYLSYPHVGCVACIAKSRAGFGKLDPVFCFILAMPRPIQAGIKYINMDSKISIELDFDRDRLPVIQVLHKTSDDVRDGIVGNFIQQLDHTSISRWLRFEYRYKRSDGALIWHVVPISSSIDELEQEANLMLAMVKSLREQMPADSKDA
jgi:hypothetical protein